MTASDFVRRRIAQERVPISVDRVNLFCQLQLLVGKEQKLLQTEVPHWLETASIDLAAHLVTVLKR